MSRGVIFDPGTGVIDKVVRGSPELFALQVSPGQAMFAVMDDTGAVISDDKVFISESGTLAWIDPTSVDPTDVLPQVTLEYAPT